MFKITTKIKSKIAEDGIKDSDTPTKLKLTTKLSSKTDEDNQPYDSEKLKDKRAARTLYDDIFHSLSLTILFLLFFLLYSSYLFNLI